MTMLRASQPNAVTFRVEELVEQVREGRVRIPEFQRPLRWQAEDVSRLFDSILRGYPIGSLLLWARSAPAAQLRVGSLVVDAPQLQEAYWVVDGQQRITSLACALLPGSDDPRFALSYDLKARKLVKPSGAPSQIRLPSLFDNREYLRWLTQNPDQAEHFDEGARVATLLRTYSAPAYVVKNDDEQVLREIFDRMNNFGRRLSLAEVFTAIHRIDDGAGKAQTLLDIGERAGSLNFGSIDENTLLRAFLARRAPDVTREIRSEFESGIERGFQGETKEDAYRGTEEALLHTVQFLQEDAGIPHIALLPYRYLLVVLVRFFAHHPVPQPRNRELLVRWFWRAALLGPALGRGAYTSATRILAGCIKPEGESESVEALLAAVVAAPEAVPFPPHYKSKMAEVRFLLCAMWDRGPRSPVTGARYDRAELARALEHEQTASSALGLLVPRRRVETANRFFLLDEYASNGADMFAMPDSVEKLAALNSHGLSQSLLGLVNEQPEVFFEERQQVLRQWLNEFLSRMTGRAFEDTPPLMDLNVDDENDEDLSEEAENVAEACV